MRLGEARFFLPQLWPWVLVVLGCSTKGNAPVNAAHDAALDGNAAQESGDGSSAGGDSSVPTDPSDARAPKDASNGPHDAGLEALAAIMNQYKSWEPQAAEPVSISEYIFALCRLPTLHETEFAESEHGEGRYLLDWANPLAIEGLARKGVPEFAVGAAIVKEKLVRDGEGFKVVALGIMSKREAGFDPANGDWEYGYWEKGPGLLSSAKQAAYCGGCHAGAAPSDFVFMDDTWLTD